MEKGASCADLFFVNSTTLMTGERSDIMSNKIHFIPVILMGIICLAGCSVDEEALPPCPFSFSDLWGGKNLETQAIEQTSETAGSIADKMRDKTELETCLDVRCGKDEECAAKERLRARSAWIWSVINALFAIHPLDWIIMIMLIIVIARFRPPPLHPEKWHQQLWFRTILLFLSAYILIIPIRQSTAATLATVLWWLYLVVLVYILIRQKKGAEDDSESEDDEDDLPPPECPFCGGARCGPYCEKGLGLLPGYSEEEPE